MNLCGHISASGYGVRTGTLRLFPRLRREAGKFTSADLLDRPVPLFAIKVNQLIYARPKGVSDIVIRHDCRHTPHHPWAKATLPLRRIYITGPASH